jgi:putative zinc finger/helix-turn-helix YgiT family protein
MKSICPHCEKVTDIETIHATEKVDIRGETIEVESEYQKCAACGEDFESTEGPDSLADAYRIYRERHALLQPEEISRWRKGYGLTQRELSALLGWGGATLSRYENGALQSESHEKMLRLVMEPRNLRRLIEESPHSLEETKRDRLLGELGAVENESCSFERIFEERFGSYDADLNSGYRKFDLQKLFNVILFFCEDGGQLKTKLNKLLFYADFKCFRDNAISLTGAHYVHLPYGPVPDNFNFYFSELTQERKLVIYEIDFGEYVGENLKSSAPVDLSIFAESEKAILHYVKEYFADYSSSKITRYSHEEKGYIETNENELISYEHANALRI